jgi:hypothetical protein
VLTLAMEDALQGSCKDWRCISAFKQVMLASSTNSSAMDTTGRFPRQSLFNSKRKFLGAACIFPSSIRSFR